MNDLHIRQKQSGVMAATMDDQAVVMELASGRFFDLDATGVVIWAMLEQPTSLNAIVSTLLAKYEIDEATCASEVTGFLTQMESLSLIETQSAPW